MSDRRSAATRRRTLPRHRAWCCSLVGAAPQSPDPRPSILSPSSKPKPFPSSPTTKLGRGIIDAHRRIRSPGRVSPIDSGPVPPSPDSLLPLPENPSLFLGEVAAPSPSPSSSSRCLDLRLSLKGKDGRSLVMELNPEVLSESSAFFAEKVRSSHRKAVAGLGGCQEVEVGDVEDLDAFRETVELMYERDMTRRLMEAGVSRVIAMLEVSSTIMFDRGITSCLKYLEAVPWNESEEEKLKSLFARCMFDDAASQDVLARLGPKDLTNSEGLAVCLIQSVTNGTNGNARKEMQSLVTGFLSKSSVYQKDLAGLNKESLYSICHTCLSSLVELFEEATNSVSSDRPVSTKETKPLVERLSKQVENLNWLLEILIDKQMAEDFVSLWADQVGLIKMHESASPMVRYELSRISASIFIVLGRGKLQCRAHTRVAVIRAWFGPMLKDFGWLQRCSKGLDMRVVEESLGQTLLTLPMKQQQSLFEEWFQTFAGKGTESPNLSSAFQVWWRRAFVRYSEARRQL